MTSAEVCSPNSLISETTDVEETLCSQLPEPVLKRFYREGLFGLGEDYIEGRWTCERLDDFLVSLIENLSPTQRKWNLQLAGYLIRDLLQNPQTGQGVFEVGKRHYDLGNDLFQAMLDPSMSYTSGIWDETDTLSEAQENKLRRICDQLGLRPGMRVLDIGCGFGNFAHYAATHYGASVVGLTISREQHSYAAKRCAHLPVEIRLQDYREYRGMVDRVVSIEMIEAVGRKNLPSFFSAVHRALLPGGRFVLQAISGESFTRHSSVFIDQFVLWLLHHIFPNGYLPRLSHLVEVGTTDGLMIERMDGFGADYDRTLQSWKANFDHAWPSLQNQYSERFKRMWHYYLCGCMAVFRTKLVTVYQISYLKP